MSAVLSPDRTPLRPLRHAEPPAGVSRVGTALRSPHVGRVLRCLAVSCFTTLVSLVTLTVMTAGLGVTAWGANVVATVAGTVPSYLLMRRWVWAVSGSIDLRREVVPFWTLSFAGLVLSTLAVAVTDRIATGMAVDATPHQIALWVANVGSFAVLWVAQYLLLDRVLFGPRSPVTPADLTDIPPPCW